MPIFVNTFFEKQLLYDLFQAYYDARKNKRNTINALLFEIDYEAKLFELYEEIKDEKYEVKPSMCFISLKPLQREIFAADFRDRIIHHLIYNYISPFFERLFINDAYSCRKNKGTSYGIKRLNHFIRSCSENYKQDCYILKLDIKGYFMAIDKNILYKKIEKIINRFRKEASFDVDFILRLIYKVIFNDPTKNCRIKGKRENWLGLPKSKSLFYAEKNKGLPIGNLTSQLFANIYLNDFDHFAKYKLGCKYYSRYVDDIAVVHKDNKCLKLIIPVLRKYLKGELSLELHPRKIYLQHFSKGVAFLGAVIKPYRIYIKNRVKGNFYKKIMQKLAEIGAVKFVASANSYLGILRQFNTYNLRKTIYEKGLGGGA